MASKPSLSVMRLIHHNRNRSEDTSDSPDALSSSPSALTSLSNSRKHNNNSPKRSQFNFPALGKVGSADSASSRRGKNVQISQPWLPSQTFGDNDYSDLARCAHIASRLPNTHRRNVSEGTAPSTMGGRGMKPPPPMNQRALQPIHPDFLPGGALQRSVSHRQQPPRPPRPDEVRPSALRRPSLKSISSDSFVQTANRASLALSDPGSIAFDRRSKDDLDGAMNMDDFSADLRKFIMEAERAFDLPSDAGSSNTTQSKANHAKQDSTSSTGTTTPCPGNVSRPPIPRKSVGSGTSVRRSQTTRPLKPSATVSGQAANATDPVPARDQPVMARRNSTTGPQRSRSITKKPSRGAARDKRLSKPRPEPKGTKWGLSEGMTDILTGQRFKKMEVDELLTPDRFEKFRMQREAEEQKRKSLENLAKTSTEDDEIDRSSSWIEIGFDTSEDDSNPTLSPPGSKPSSPEPDDASPPTPPPKDGEECDDLSEEIPIILQSTSDNEDLPRRKPFDPVHDALPPTPPPKSRLRKIPPLKTENKKPKNVDIKKAKKAEPPSPDMPSSGGSSIYTDSSFSPGPATPVDANKLRGKLAGAEDDANIYLRSTPFSLTRPEFEHGPITFSKAEMGKGALKMDDTLDWTAFQMAILGGSLDMGDVVDEWEDARLAEELVNWFDGHGFETWGRMVLEDEAMAEAEAEAAAQEQKQEPAPAPVIKDKPKKKKSHSSSDSCSSASSSTSSLGSFSSKNSRTGATPPPLNIRRKQPPLPTLTARCMPSSDGSLGQNLPTAVRVKSPARGPAVVGGGGPGDVDEDEADAPMGFNLSNDLGEYLQWEAEYAYATDL